jgi:hypothetical protein
MIRARNRNVLVFHHAAVRGLATNLKPSPDNTNAKVVVAVVVRRCSGVWYSCAQAAVLVRIDSAPLR